MTFGAGDGGLRVSKVMASEPIGGDPGRFLARTSGFSTSRTVKIWPGTVDEALVLSVSEDS